MLPDSNQAQKGSASGWPAVCGFLTARRKDFTTRDQVVLRVCLSKLGTVKQGRAQDRRNTRKGPRWGSLGSLEMLWERNEPRRGCFGSLQSQRKGALERASGAQPRRSGSCPLLFWLPVLWRPLEFGRCVPVGKGRCGEIALWVLWLEGFKGCECRLGPH